VYSEESDEDLARLGNHLHGVEESGDEEVAFLPGTTDSEAPEDRKCLKLTLKSAPSSFLVSEMLT
jgi:hypothetical protein